MKVIMTDREKERFVIEMNKPFNLCRNIGAKYILLNINHLDIPLHRISCGCKIDRFAQQSNLINNIIEEKDIPQSIKDKLKNLGITE